MSRFAPSRLLTTLAVLPLVLWAQAAQAQIRYDSISAPSAASAGLSSTDLNRVVGDRVSMTTFGKLDAMQFTLFNSGSSAGSLLTAQVNISFYNAATFNATNLAANTAVGSFNTNVNFGAGMNPGFFSTVSVTSLSPLGIVFSSPDIVITQRVVSKTGLASRLGVVLFTQDVVGTQYLNNANIFLSDAANGTGLFNVGTNKIGYQITLAAPEPGTLALLAFGGIAVLARRRKA